MSNINKSFIEQYQIEYQKDPNSKVFAPLAEAYRKIGMLDKAYEVALAGISKHPNFVGGRVALGKILGEKKLFSEALKHFDIARKYSPDNLLAHNGAANALLNMREPKKALKAYKMVLFLNPNDQDAQSIINKLESLSADEYDDDVFSFESIDVFLTKDFEKNNLKKEKKIIDGTTSATNKLTDNQNKHILRATSLADSYIIRNDNNKALKVLESATNSYGPHPELEKRLELLSYQDEETDESSTDDNQNSDIASSIKPLSRQQLILEKKRNSLENLMLRVKQKRNEL